MNLKAQRPLAQIAIFLWLGFVFAISFMEAWLKFQAPGITLPLGLGIGKLVFGALNLMEWVFAVIILGDFLLRKKESIGKNELWFAIPFLALIIQSFWLLPEMNARAAQIINGVDLPDSNLHYFYVGLEIIKVICLFIFGCTLYKKTTL